MNGAPSVSSPSPKDTRSDPVTSIPTKPEALGIVIRSGAPQAKPVRFWAYLWAADDDDTRDLHWHQRVPSEHAA